MTLKNTAISLLLILSSFAYAMETRIEKVGCVYKKKTTNNTITYSKLDTRKNIETSATYYKMEKIYTAQEEETQYYKNNAFTDTVDRSADGEKLFDELSKLFKQQITPKAKL